MSGDHTFGFGGTRRLDHERSRGHRGPALPFSGTRSLPDRVFISSVNDAPSCTQPRHGSGLLKNDRCGDAASCKLAEQRRRQVDTDTTPVVNLAQDDPRPCPASI